MVNDIHKRGGTILGTSRGGHDTGKIVDSIQDRGINQVNSLLCETIFLQKFPMILNDGIVNLESINDINVNLNDGFSLFGLWVQVYIIGGDGTQRGAAVIYEVW